MMIALAYYAGIFVGFMLLICVGMYLELRDR